MPGPADVQITIAQQVLTGYQQQLHQQQPIVISEQRLAMDKTKAQEAETTIESIEKGSSGIKIEKKRGRERGGIKKRRKKQEEERVSNGIRGKIIDVTG